MKYVFDKETVEQFNNLIESYSYRQDLGYLMNSHYQVILGKSSWSKGLYGKLNDLTMEEFLALNLNKYEVKNSKLDTFKIEYSKHLINSNSVMLYGKIGSPKFNVNNRLHLAYSEGYIKGVDDALEVLNTSVLKLGLLNDWKKRQ